LSDCETLCNDGLLDLATCRQQQQQQQQRQQSGATAQDQKGTAPRRQPPLDMCDLSEVGVNFNATRGTASLESTSTE